MALSMYRASVPLFVQVLQSMSAIIDKAEAHCEARKIDPAVLLGYRLAPDMYPLSRQFQIAADMAKGGAARLAGVEPPSYPDTETTFPELKARLAKTLDFVQSFTPDQIDGSDERQVTIQGGGNTFTFTGEAYLIHFVIPNVLFHAATAYDILRHAGLELGKRDFIGQF